MNDPEFVGMARMDEKRNIVLDLYAREKTAHGTARFVYSPEHLAYQDILDHVGGLLPGESKLVKPFS